VEAEGSGPPGCPSSTLTENGCIVFQFSGTYLQAGNVEDFFWEAMETAPSAGVSSAAAKPVQRDAYGDSGPTSGTIITAATCALSTDQRCY
jgi:hypothetical protein